jgi:hypothetical protein
VIFFVFSVVYTLAIGNFIVGRLSAATPTEVESKHHLIADDVSDYEAPKK